MSNLYEKAGKRNSPLNTVKLADRAIPTSGQSAPYGPPRMPKLNLETGEYIEGTTGTYPFQWKTPASLAETVRDNPSTYSPPQMPTQTEYGTAGTFQTKAPGLASTTHDDILEFNTSALSNSNAPTISAYSPTTLNNSLSPTISAYNRGTVLNRFNQGSIFALGPAASGPSMDVGLAATDYRARTAGNRETKSWN